MTYLKFRYRLTLNNNHINQCKIALIFDLLDFNSTFKTNPLDKKVLKTMFYSNSKENHKY